MVLRQAERNEEMAETEPKLTILREKTKILKKNVSLLNEGIRIFI